MDLRTKHLLVVEIYLVIWIGGLIGLLFLFWPRPLDSTSEVMDPNEYAAQITDPNSNDNEVNILAQTKPSDPNSQESESADSSIIEQCPVSSIKFVGLILIMGALGACLHGITSLAEHRGKCDFSEKWTLWYLYRPFVGGVLALIFYLIIYGGLAYKIDGNKNKFFATLGISGLIGLFSKQALNKLSLIFDTIFASDKEKDEKLSKKSQNTNTQLESESQGQSDTNEAKTTKPPPEQNQP